MLKNGGWIVIIVVSLLVVPRMLFFEIESFWIKLLYNIGAFLIGYLIAYLFYGNPMLKGSNNHHPDSKSMPHKKPHEEISRPKEKKVELKEYQTKDHNQYMP